MLTDVGGIPVVQSAMGNGEGGWGMGGGLMAIVLVIALLGGGLWGNRGAAEAGTTVTKELEMVNSNANAHYTELSGQIQTSNVLSQNQIEQVKNNQAQQLLFKEMCDTNSNLSDRICGVSKDVLENRYANQLCCLNSVAA